MPTCRHANMPTCHHIQGTLQRTIATPPHHHTPHMSAASRCAHVWNRYIGYAVPGMWDTPYIYETKAIYVRTCITLQNRSCLRRIPNLVSSAMLSLTRVTKSFLLALGMTHISSFYISIVVYIFSCLIAIHLVSGCREILGLESWQSRLFAPPRRSIQLAKIFKITWHT